VTSTSNSLPWCYAVYGQHNQRRALIESYLSLCVADPQQRPRSVGVERADVIFCNDEKAEVDAAIELARGRTVVTLGANVEREGVIPLHRPLSARSFSWLLDYLADQRQADSLHSTQFGPSSLNHSSPLDHEKTMVMASLSADQVRELTQLRARYAQEHPLGAAPVAAPVASATAPAPDPNVQGAGRFVNTGTAAQGGIRGSASMFQASDFAMTRQESPDDAAAFDASRSMPIVYPPSSAQPSDPDFPETRQGDDPFVALQSQRGTPAASVPIGIGLARSAGYSRFVINTASGAVIVVDTTANLVIEPGATVSRALAAPMDACWVSEIAADQPIELAEAGRAASFNRMCWNLAQVGGSQPLDSVPPDTGVFVPRWPNLGGTPIDPSFMRILNRVSKQAASMLDLQAEATEAQVRQALNFLYLMGALDVPNLGSAAAATGAQATPAQSISQPRPGKPSSRRPGAPAKLGWFARLRRLFSER
jgi:hypothetical protein